MGERERAVIRKDAGEGVEEGPAGCGRLVELYCKKKRFKIGRTREPSNELLREVT